LIKGKCQLTTLILVEIIQSFPIVL
jgi:hypothetical protein